ncbi:homoserine O-acetyltransferase MetX [Xanthomonas campestris]|uniref:homoserine O-acetyltransferase MetX n=1 Tax=Xanthomonas campestris TaxID=339 RepID=UPI001E4A1D07|nr:homoserine O-acetyltransferase [Xanthomonas campestris]MCC4603547.1 homoserine O-acetyltransferase [Xanthomonas campestris pv. parthenii]
MTEFIPTGSLFHALPSPFPMKRGGALHQARIAYETWGTLAADRSNALLIVTGLSPNAHAAANQANPEPGWWEAMLGPGKPIDTTRWFVVCVNSLGSCKGSTGPASIDLATGERYRLRFPDLSIEDVADAAADVVRALGIAQLACLIGNSMGGMTALALLLRHPGIARSHINISGSAQALPFSIAIRSLQREAIRLDPNWNGGHYDDTRYPESGMRMARKLGVITYRSALEWDGRFGRVRLDSEQADDDPFGLEFQVESYLEGHARRFVRFFDPNCYLYLSRSMDWFDLADYAEQAPSAQAPLAGAGDAGAPVGNASARQGSSDGKVLAGLSRIRIARALSIGANTDILFPVQQQEQIADGLRAGGADARFIGLDSPQGHDAFLVDFARFGPAVRDFLDAC